MSPQIESFIISFFASVTLVASTFALGWLSKKLKDQRSLGHVKTFIGDSRCVKVVISSTVISKLSIARDNGSSSEAIIPHNHPQIPMPEGQAIAEIVQAIGNSTAQKVKILVVPAADFQDDGTPFVTIGGPSINIVARKYAAQYFPDFGIKYPEHVANWRGSTIYEPKLRENKLLDDYGFSFTGTTAHNSRFILFFGVWAFGALAATRCYLSLPHKSDARERAVSNKPTLLVTYVKIAGYSIEKYELYSVMQQ